MTAPQVPPWVRGNSVDVSPASNSPTGSPNWNDRGTADGNSVQPDSDFGKFSCNIDITLGKRQLGCCCYGCRPLLLRYIEGAR